MTTYTTPTTYNARRRMMEERDSIYAAIHTIVDEHDEETARERQLAERLQAIHTALYPCMKLAFDEHKARKEQAPR